MRIVGNPPSGGKQPTTPTIGTATDGGTGTSVSVAFTPSTYIGKGTITYTATSSPGSLTGTGSGSPITVSGLTTGTTYSFTVAGTTNYGVSSLSSAQSNFVTPVNPSSFESIATTTLSSANSTITFSSIPSTYKHLQVRINARTSEAGLSNYAYFLQWSGSSTYPNHFLLGNGTAASAGENTGGSEVYIDSGLPAATATANAMGVAIIDIADYASTTKNKTIRLFGGFDTNSTNGRVYLYSGMRLSTTAISSLTIATNSTFISGSTFALYGIKG